MIVVDVVVKAARFLHEQEEARKKRAKVEQVNYVRKISSKMLSYFVLMYHICPKFLLKGFPNNLSKKCNLSESIFCPKMYFVLIETSNKR